MMLLVALLAVVGHAEARGVAHTNQQAKMTINPPIKDVAGDKKFFGPPFPADYPDDKRPKIDHKLLDQVRNAGEPYPQLQKTAHFDSDYVKDENNDGGHWKAQFEYDTLRKELLEKEAAEKRAAGEAGQQSMDEAAAKKKADEAAKKAEAAQKDADAAKAEEAGAAKAESGDDGKQEEDTEGKKVATSVEEAKKQVDAAEKALAEQKAAFAECKKKLEMAEAELASAKAQLKSLEDQEAAGVKLWAEERSKAKAARESAHKSREEAMTLKHAAAKERLLAAHKDRDILLKAYAKEKADSDESQKMLEKRRAEVKKTKDNLEQAKLRLQGLRGGPRPMPKSGSTFASLAHVGLLSLLSACSFL